ncbi:alpha/beta hydrolase [Nocardia alba]|uniref:Alpha/beta hydrolase family protein n=1 Tax=Nocardia alba TaxID=225051 RepID=A0A4R1FRB0_9NOCA|nr:alpha/beta hydrolase [Nocardia alba]TCJ97457.1 alpha/beta hydrolase family protein [Nocardia alba]
MGQDVEFPGLGEGIRSRFVDDVNGLRVHILESGYRGSRRPLVLLLHGFPELAYSWRKVLAPLADAGFHVVAPDQRGYGRTTGSDVSDLMSFRTDNLARDALGLVRALGYDRAHLVGHDFGSVVAGWTTLADPRVVGSLTMMSAPFAGVGLAKSSADLNDALRALSPPRRHYQHYFAGTSSGADLIGAPQGIADFLRAYFHMKSADWPGNADARELPGATAHDLALLPRYYVMDAGVTMPETVAPHLPSPRERADCAWLTDEELGFYAREFGRTQFQGPLNWYRALTLPRADAPTDPRIEVPTQFIAGQCDWGIWQTPGGLRTMAEVVCTRFGGSLLIPDAGHWVQQEQPLAVLAQLSRFLDET